MSSLLVWHGHAVVPAPGGGRYLVIDDNDRYAEALMAELHRRGATTLRGRSAGEGIALCRAHGPDLDGIVTDIDMETQLAGLRVVWYVHRRRLPALLAVTTTGLDARWAFRWNRWVFTQLWPVDYLLPKRPIREHGQVLWLATGARRKRL